MDMVNALGNYFLSLWLWSITWGIYHVPFAIFYMFLALKLFVHMGWMASIIISLGSNLFGWITYTVLVLGVLMLGMSFEYIPTMPHAQVCERLFLISFGLALVYTVLQTLLFACANLGAKLNFPRAVLLSLLVNLLAALTVYAMLPLYC